MRCEVLYASHPEGVWRLLGEYETEEEAIKAASKTSRRKRLYTKVYEISDGDLIVYYKPPKKESR